jgi:hypothetical protein
VLCLTERRCTATLLPACLEQGFRWLMSNLRPGDSLVFYFSGEGDRRRRR